MPKARSKELVLSYGSTYLYSQKTGYYTMLDIFFQYGREPVLIHRELIGFEGIRGILLSFSVTNIHTVML